MRRAVVGLMAIILSPLALAVWLGGCMFDALGIVLGERRMLMGTPECTQCPTLRAQLDAAVGAAQRLDAAWLAQIATLTRERDALRAQRDEARERATEGDTQVAHLLARAQAAEEFRLRVAGALALVAPTDEQAVLACLDQTMSAARDLRNNLRRVLGVEFATDEQIVQHAIAARSALTAAEEAKAKAEEEAKAIFAAHARLTADLASATTRAQRAEEEAGRLREGGAEALAALVHRPATGRDTAEGILRAALASPQGEGKPVCQHCGERHGLFCQNAAPPTEPGKPEVRCGASVQAPDCDGPEACGNPLPCAAHPTKEQA